MATPNYVGTNQPLSSSGSWWSGWFGSTPAYVGANQTAQTSQAAPRLMSFLSNTAPTYKVAAALSGNDIDAVAPTQFAIVIPRQVIEPQT
jgi:hypothetical protein